MSDSLDDWGGAEFALAADRLDTPDVIEAADPGDVLRQVASAAAQVRTALRSCQEANLSAFTPDARPRALVAAGLGSAGLAGEVLGAVVGPGSPVQVIASQAERLPGWVGAADAVIAVSAPGATAQTLAIAAEAARRGCRLACVGTKDSPLQRVAEQARAPFITVEPAGPSGPVLPRSALWELAIPLLVIAERLGVARLEPEVYEKAANRLEDVSHQCQPGQRVVRQPGQVAGPGPGRLAAGGLGDVAAERGRRPPVRRPAQRDRQVPGDRGRAAGGRPGPGRRVRRAVRPGRALPARRRLPRRTRHPTTSPAWRTCPPGSWTTRTRR